MKKISLIITMAIALFTGCKKVDYDFESKGESNGQFRILTPSNGANLVLNAATPSAPVTITWSSSIPGVNAVATYKWVAALKTGSIDAPILELPSNNAGMDTKLTLTYAQVDAALAAKGVAAGAVVDLIWSVVADNGSTKLRSADVYGIKITRFGDGATPFILLSPLQSSLNAPLAINPTSTSENIAFRWTKSLPKTGGTAIAYKILFAEKKIDANGAELPVNWSAPLFSIVANNTGVDSFANVSYKSISDSLSAKGFTNLLTPVQLKWTVAAASGTWNQFCDFVNDLVIVREVKVYIVGSATPGGWDIAQSTRMIEDPRFPGTYFSYIQLSGGNEIKFVNGQNWPPFAGAIAWGQDLAAPAGTITSVNGGDNIPVATSGVYRVTFDLSNKKFYLQTAISNGIGGMGMIGNFQGWSQPATKTNYLGVNKFILLANMNTNDEFKFHDGNDWNNSANNLHRWFAVDNNGKMVIDPGSGFGNFKWTGASGRMRAIWDGSNTLDLKYSLTPASEMRVVGNGIDIVGVNDWDPPTSPQMAYVGNGVWQATLALKAGREIKFVAGNAWGAFDYEDAGGGKIRYDGNLNFNTPATAGTYTITLNEHTGTYTIL
jgi:starch-binding outer membrane protein SusE/F